MDFKELGKSCGNQAPTTLTNNGHATYHQGIVEKLKLNKHHIMIALCISFLALCHMACNLVNFSYKSRAFAVFSLK